MKVPDCSYRYPFPQWEDQSFCAHPLVTVAEGVVQPSMCRTCGMASTVPDLPERPLPRQLRPAHEVPACLFRGPPATESDKGRFVCRHPCHALTTPNQCRLCDDYAPRLNRGDVKSWSIGITTAPRRKPTLRRTLQSLRSAGWNEWQLFAEPGSTIPGDVDEHWVTWRAHTMGAFSNWLLALMELVLRIPDADAYFLCQDDVLFEHGVRAYLERVLWPMDSPGIVSIYCAAFQDPGGAPRFEAIDAGWDTCGALALIFPNAIAKAALVAPMFLGHRLRGPHQGTCNIDSIVGLWCRQVSLPFVIHTPSLAQHIGETSSIFGARCGHETPKRSARPTLTTQFLCNTSQTSLRLPTTSHREEIER